MWGAIIGVLTALPELLKLLNGLGKFLKDTFGDNPKKFIKDAGEAFEKLNKAETKPERYAAARDIQSLIRRL